MSNITISEEEVINAAHELLAIGQKISLNKLRAKLNKGSYSTIKQILEKHNLLTPRLEKNQNLINTITQQSINSLNSNSSNNSNNINNNASNLIRDLKNNLNSISATNDLLASQLRKQQQYLEKECTEIILNKLLIEILFKHLKSPNNITSLIPEYELTTLNSNNEHISVLIKNIQQEFLEIFNILLNDYHKNPILLQQLMGKENSLYAIARMFNDLHNRKKQNEQAYNY